MSYGPSVEERAEQRAAWGSQVGRNDAGSLPWPRAHGAEQPVAQHSLWSTPTRTTSAPEAHGHQHAPPVVAEAAHVLMQPQTAQVAPAYHPPSARALMRSTSRRDGTFLLAACVVAIVIVLSAVVAFQGGVVPEPVPEPTPDPSGVTADPAPSTPVAPAEGP